MIAVDTDVLIAATAADGTIRRTLLALDEELVALDGTFENLARHASLLAARARTDRDGIRTVVETLARYVDEVDFEDYEDAYTGLEMAYPWAEVRELDLCAMAKATGARVWTENEAFEEAGDLDVVDTDDLQREVAT